MSDIARDDLLLTANTLRGLAMDGVQKANSGHPGMPMGMADIAAVLWLKHLKHSPSNPDWPDRDRFVLSAGHGSMLIYSLLHLSGYDLPISELQSFRQLHSKTPGHPEYGETIGVETTTGPLGQGCGNGAGMALAENMLAARFNTDAFSPVDHFTYVIASDGDLMEGVSHEAFAIAGHLQIGKLVVFYDSNDITIEGSTDLAYSDDVRKRFEGYHWNVLEIDGHNYDEIESAIESAKSITDKPTIVICRTHIAHGAPTAHDTSEAHGAPLGDDEVAATKQALGLPPDEAFHVPERVRALFAARKRELEELEAAWNASFAAFREAEPDLALAWCASFSHELPPDLESVLPEFEVGASIATRKSSQAVIQQLAKALPNLVGGSADLAPSTNTLIKGAASVAPRAFGGRNMHWGIREHGMASMLNGMTLHGGLRVYGSTFFTFADYCRPALRLAAIMRIPVIHVFTHDSVYVGEDGPTHEPVEHIASLRAMPNMTVIRPAEATETGPAWLAALRNQSGPTALILTRQGLPVFDRNELAAASGVAKGAYVLWQSGEGPPELILIASGSEVPLILDAGRLLAGEANVRVVSMPSWELFEKQDEAYRASVFPEACTARLGVEAGASFGWERYVGDTGRVHAIDRYGMSAPYESIATELGFTPNHIAGIARDLLSSRTVATHG
jgi:transketolase